MNTNKNLISIVVPVYNVEKYLHRCIESIIAQTYKNFEIILVNDGSTDNSSKICNEYINLYKNIFLLNLNNTNPGASDARNAGIEFSKGEYITFIDSDDYVHPQLLEILIHTLKIENVLMSICSYEKVFEYKNSILIDFNKRNLINITDNDAMDLIISNQTNSAVWAKLYHISLFNEIRFPTGKHNEDMFTIPLLFKCAEKIATNSYPLYFYSQEGLSLCRSDFNYNMLDMIDAIEFWYIHVTKFYPNLIAKVRTHYYKSLINNCQFLVSKKDNYGIQKFEQYKKILFQNLFFILFSKLISKNTKIKLIFFRINLFMIFSKG